jgi:hypothetical protein
LCKAKNIHKAKIFGHTEYLVLFGSKKYHLPAGRQAKTAGGLNALVQMVCSGR